MLESLKERVFEANLDLVRQGLVTLTWGNASGYDRDEGLVVIKPSGVPYHAMRPEDMVVVDLDGRVVEGELKPSSDVPTHLLLYVTWPSLGGVIHTHSIHATMFAQACVPIPCYGTTHADHFYGRVPVTRPLTQREVEGDYEANTGEVIVERFNDLDWNPSEVPAVLVASHGPFAWGMTVERAVENAIALEAVAEMAVGTMQLHPGMPAVPQYIQDKHYFRKHGPGAYYGQDKET